MGRLDPKDVAVDVVVVSLAALVSALAIAGGVALVAEILRFAF